MNAVLAIAAAIIGALFWANRRSPVIVSDAQDVVVSGDVDGCCGDACDDADYQDDDRGPSNDYGNSSTGDGRDD